jgi:hypothetical protein
VAVRFIGGGNRNAQRKSPTCHKSLTNFITYCCIEYTSSWAGFELTTLVVICTDCINYHTITKIGILTLLDKIFLSCSFHPYVTTLYLNRDIWRDNICDRSSVSIYNENNSETNKTGTMFLTCQSKYVLYQILSKKIKLYSSSII